MATKPGQTATTKPTKPTKPAAPSKPSQPAKAKTTVGVDTKTKVDKKAVNAEVKKMEQGKQVVKHARPSELDNKFTQQNLQISKNRVKTIRNQPAAKAFAKAREKQKDKDYEKRIADRAKKYRDNDRDDRHRHWCAKMGGHGGYCYPVRPIVVIEEYDFFPCWDWFFYTDFDPGYYEVYYGGDYSEYVPETAFEFARVFMPTDTLRDLAAEVSGLSAKNQKNFRLAITKFLSSVEAQISQSLGATFQLGEGDVVVNHYENLQNKAIEIEGFVDRGDNVHAAFKAILDLQKPEDTLVYVGTDEVMTADQEYTLGVIDQRISALGGNPFRIDHEPDSGQNNDNN